LGEPGAFAISLLGRVARACIGEGKTLICWPSTCGVSACSS